MTTTVSTLSTLPEAPTREMASSEFAEKADLFLPGLNTLQTEMNTSIGQINTVAGEINTNAGTATTAASTATTQAGIATTQAGLATTNGAAQVTLAAAQVTLATTQASNALTSANNAAASYDAFDDRYLGSKTSDPTVDNDGNALITGALYFNSASTQMKVWSGTTWIITYLPASGYQETLVSGTNIKTINSTSILGSGDINTTTLTISNKTSAYTVIASDLGKIINCTSGTFTISLTAAATLGTGFNCSVWNTGTETITIDPNASETIDGVATIILRQGEGLDIVCDGTNWQIANKKPMRGYAERFSRTGVTCIASGDRSISIGVSNGGATGNDAYAIGYYTSATGNESLALGARTTAGASNSSAIGKGSGFIGATTATGSGAMALGGSYASGEDSFAAAIANNTSSYGATGANSISLGNQAKASSSEAISFGYRNIASGQFSVCIGASNTATSDNNIAIGLSNSVSKGMAIGFSNFSDGYYSIAMGYKAKTVAWGGYSFASGAFAVVGDAQSGKIVLRAITTTATPTVLTSDINAASTTNQMILPDDSTYAFTILVVARRTDTDNESAGYEFKGVVDRNASASTTAIVGTVVKTVLAEDTSAWDCNVTADTTNGGLSVTATGEASKSIRWVATCWTSEVTG